jgi:hypothetical protein
MQAGENYKIRSLVVYIIRFDQLKEGEIYRSCSISGKDENSIQSFVGNLGSEETTC